MSAPTTSAWASFARTFLAVSATALPSLRSLMILHLADPVTAVMPTEDAQTYLATTLDARARLMDASTGKLLNEFAGHAHASYQCRAVLGHGEASVILGDEDGRVWAWDLLDVHISLAHA
jgi:WD40 repeat protein